MEENFTIPSHITMYRSKKQNRWVDFLIYGSFISSKIIYTEWSYYVCNWGLSFLIIEKLSEESNYEVSTSSRVKALHLLD